MVTKGKGGTALEGVRSQADGGIRAKRYLQLGSQMGVNFSEGVLLGIQKEGRKKEVVPCYWEETVQQLGRCLPVMARCWRQCAFYLVAE